MKRTQALIKTLFSTHKFNKHDAQILQSQAEEVLVFSSHYFEMAGRIKADRGLTPQGKTEALGKLRTPVITEINNWKTKRLEQLTADIKVQRAALQTQAPKFEPGRLAVISGKLEQYSATERAVIYSAATDRERQELEAASALAGRVFTKTERGGIEWQHLLDEDAVREAVEARAMQQNPDAYAKLKEVEAVRDIHASLATTAIKEIEDEGSWHSSRLDQIEQANS